MGAFSGCGGIYRSRLSHRSVPHPNLLLRPLLRGVEVAAPVRPSHYEHLRRRTGAGGFPPLVPGTRPEGAPSLHRSVGRTSADDSDFAAVGYPVPSTVAP